MTSFSDVIEEKKEHLSRHELSTLLAESAVRFSPASVFFALLKFDASAHLLTEAQQFAQHSAF